MDISNLHENLNFIFHDSLDELVYESDFELLVKLILSPRANENIVNKIGNLLVSKFPNIKDLYNANLTSIEKIVRPIGYYHQKSLRLKSASDLIISKFEGHIPKKYSDLIQIPGIGDKCAKKYLSLINKAHYIIIDAHLIRVLTRLDLISSDFSHTQIENFIKSNLKNSNYTDFSNLLNLFGKRLCKSRKPQCIKCPFKNFCNFIN
tara:strand:+ start:68601 stop:69218 length:618 start_codon:yes stop_codon:yes gene_type:complete